MSERDRVEIGYDLFAPFTAAFARHPFPCWERLAVEFPVAWHRDMKRWVVSSYECVSEILRSPYVSRCRADGGHPRRSRPEPEKTEIDRLADHALLFVPASAHRRLRRLSSPAFAKMVVESIESRVRECVRDVFDEVGAPAEFDFQNAIAARIPLLAIARTLGLPVDDDEALDRLRIGLEVVTNALVPMDRRKQTIPGVESGLRSLLESVRSRRTMAPRDDLLGLLLTRSDADDELSDWDVVALIASLIGGESAIDLHSFMVVTLLDHPDQYAALRGNPDLFEDALLEVIRYGGFLRLGVTRTAVADFSLGGQQISRGDDIVVSLGAASNDPRHWPNPRVFDISRSQRGNLAFGAGPHFCLGLNVAKAQTRLVIEEFSRRFPAADVVGPLRYRADHATARRMEALVIRTNLPVAVPPGSAHGDEVRVT